MPRIKTPRQERVDKPLLTIFGRVRDGEIDGPRARVELRASSFPICPRAYHIYRRLPIEKRPFARDTYMRATATLEGTALHMATQRWFGLRAGKYSLGNWVCRPCGKIRRHRYGVQYCKQCGREMDYSEYEVKKTKLTPFTGHIDMLVKTPIPLTYLVDFKGAYYQALAERKMHGAKYSHYLQANAYANVINNDPDQDFGPIDKIDKIIILYIDRGRPWHYQSWVPVQMKVSKTVYRQSVALIQTAKQSVKELRIPKGLCASADDYDAKYCEWNRHCFSPVLETMLTDEIQPLDTRPQDRRMEHRLEAKVKLGEVEE